MLSHFIWYKKMTHLFSILARYFEARCCTDIVFPAIHIDNSIT